MASGGSVVGVKYNGGVLLAADTLLSYGTLAKWPNIPRIKILGEWTAVCATGDYADFQEMTKELEGVIERHSIYSNVDDLTPREVFSYLQRRVYKKRCDFEPCLCQFVVMGCRGGDVFLGSIDDVGTRWESRCVASGYGAYIALPLLREAFDKKPDGLTRQEAEALLKDCLRVLFYRECRAINKFQIADATSEGVTIGDPFELETNWELDGFRFEPTAIIR